MDSLSLLTFLLLSATVIGLYYRKNTGLIKRKKRLKLSPNEFGGAYGGRATLFLDSSGFEIARATGTPKRDQLIKVVASL
jgi:hypothetical protein